jgi:hypothetical protein
MMRKMMLSKIVAIGRGICQRKWDEVRRSWEPSVGRRLRAADGENRLAGAAIGNGI